MRGARAPPRLSRVSARANATFMSPSIRLIRRVDPSRRPPGRRVGPPQRWKIRDACVGTPRAPRGRGSLGDFRTPPCVTRARGEGANVAHINLAPAPAPAREESLGGDPAPPRGWMGPPRLDGPRAPACPSVSAQALLGEHRRGRIASLGNRHLHGDRRRERRSRWTRPRGGSSTYPSEGDRAREGRGTGRASRRARRRARLPETHGQPTRVNAVAGMAPPLRRRHARVGVSPEVSAEARGGKNRQRVAAVARRGLEVASRPRSCAGALTRAARRREKKKKTGTEIKFPRGVRKNQFAV